VSRILALLAVLAGTAVASGPCWLWLLDEPAMPKKMIESK